MDQFPLSCRHISNTATIGSANAPAHGLRLLARHPVHQSERSALGLSCRHADSSYSVRRAQDRSNRRGPNREALIIGLLESGWDRTALSVVCRTERQAELRRDRFGIRASADLSVGSRTADLIVVAVKPHDMNPVLAELAMLLPDSDHDQVLVSLAAGVSTAQLEAALPAGFPVARIMPNTSMMTGHDMSVVSAGRHLRAEHLQKLSQVFGAVGEVTVVPEAQMSAVTAVSGSGPAYFYLVAEAMIDAGVHLGLPRELSDQLVRQTMVGAATLLKESGQSADRLRTLITLRAGATAAALQELERHAVRSTFREALNAAAQWQA